MRVDETADIRIEHHGCVFYEYILVLFLKKIKVCLSLTSF